MKFVYLVAPLALATLGSSVVLAEEAFNTDANPAIKLRVDPKVETAPYGGLQANLEILFQELSHQMDNALAEEARRQGTSGPMRFSELVDNIFDASESTSASDVDAEDLMMTVETMYNDVSSRAVEWMNENGFDAPLKDQIQRMAIKAKQGPLKDVIAQIENRVALVSTIYRTIQLQHYGTLLNIMSKFSNNVGLHVARTAHVYIEQMSGVMNSFANSFGYININDVPAYRWAVDYIYSPNPLTVAYNVIVKPSNPIGEIIQSSSKYIRAAFNPLDILKQALVARILEFLEHLSENIHHFLTVQKAWKDFINHILHDANSKSGQAVRLLIPDIIQIVYRFDFSIDNKYVKNIVESPEARALAAPFVEIVLEVTQAAKDSYPEIFNLLEDPSPKNVEKFIQMVPVMTSVMFQ